MSKTSAVERLARELGVAIGTCWRYCREGMPVAANGSYDLAECRRWLELRAESSGPAAAGLARIRSAATSGVADATGSVASAAADPVERWRTARADIAEMKVDRMRARLVDMDEACLAFARRLAVVKRCLLEVPEALADRLTFDQREDVRQEIDRALMALAVDPRTIAGEALAEE